MSLIGNEVRITFWDHSMGKGLTKCRAYGIVKEETEESLIIAPWIILEEEKEVEETNTEYITVIRKAIIDLDFCTCWSKVSKRRAKRKE